MPKISPSDQLDLAKFLLSEASTNEERWAVLRILIEDGDYDPRIIRQACDDLGIKSESFDLERK